MNAQEDIVCSAYATAQYIKHTLGYKGKVYIIGSAGIQGEFDAEGIPHTGVGVNRLILREIVCMSVNGFF